MEYHIRLAESTRGTLTYVTDGEKPGGAYRSDSFFSQYVIPRLTNQTVHRVVAVVVHQDGVGELYKLLLGFNHIPCYQIIANHNIVFLKTNEISSYKCFHEYFHLKTVQFTVLKDQVSSYI